MANTGITVKLPQASLLLEELKASRTHELARAAVGEGVAQLLREHWQGLHRARHRPQGSGFYARAADLTFHREQGLNVLVGTSQRGMRQRLKGGEIRPGPGKTYLTIPVHEDAFGLRADHSSLPELEFIRTGTPGVAVLASVGRGGYFVPYYVLVKRVHQRADPTVLPDKAQTERVVERAIALAHRAAAARVKKGGRS